MPLVSKIDVWHANGRGGAGSVFDRPGAGAAIAETHGVRLPLHSTKYSSDIRRRARRRAVQRAAQGLEPAVVIIGEDRVGSVECSPGNARASVLSLVVLCMYLSCFENASGGVQKHRGGVGSRWTIKAHCAGWVRELLGCRSSAICALKQPVVCKLPRP